MNIDTRAQHAAIALQRSLTGVSPVGMPAVARRHRLSVLVGLAGALAIAFASMALASMITETPSEETATVDPTLPADPGLVALPENGTPGPGVWQGNSKATGPEAYTKFSGTGTPGAEVLAYSPYGSASTSVGDDGRFSLKLWFEDPPSGVTFPVTLTIEGVSHDFEFTWLWDPASVVVEAHQVFGESDSTTPYEKFFGTAPPGTEIVATSEFGSASTTAGEHGSWLLKVWFEGQPAGEPFPITVMVGEQAFEFDFLWIHTEMSPPPAPSIGISQEGTSSNSKDPYTRFHGTAPAGTTIAAISEYGSADLTVGESGEFSLKVWFSGAPKGVKFPITVKVNGEKWSTYYFTSNYSATTTTSGFSLTQYNTESWAASPWVKFYGTAAPGTTLAAISEYGSADMTVDSNGEYYFKLYFSTLPPVGQQFAVTVKVNGQVYGTYPFTSWFDASNVETTVNQYNTESWDASPWIKFHGTAPVGTQIEILSEYGSASYTTEGIEWLKKLHFTTLPPAGQPFPVTVKVNGETWGTYQFTSHYAPGEVEKTANKTYGSCSEDPPYDIYHGTAPAGTEVSITSAYGSGSTAADGEGNWQKQVFFSGAPIGEPFTVTVNVGGTVFEFPMTVTE